MVVGAEGESLCVWHIPALTGGERVAAALTPHAPSMERLLAHTVHVRSRQRLADLKVLLNDMGVSFVLNFFHYNLYQKVPSIRNTCSLI